MKRIVIAIMAICLLLTAPGLAMAQEENYGPPEFYVQVERDQETVDLRNSAGIEAYKIGEIPGGASLHVTDLVYNRQEDSFWVLVSYGGIAGWIDLSQTMILRGNVVNTPEGDYANAAASPEGNNGNAAASPEGDDGINSPEDNQWNPLPEGDAGEPVEVIVFTSMEEELELLESPGAEEIVAVVTDTTPLYFYGEETNVEGSDYSWYQVSVLDGETGWVRADQVIMASSQKYLDRKEKLREEEQKKLEEEQKKLEEQTAQEGQADQTGQAGQSEQPSEDLVLYDPEFTASFVNYEEGRIVTITDDAIINEVFDPETWEQISETSYYYVARTAQLRSEEASEESSRLVAFNDEDASDVWILFYDPFQPDVLVEEYKTGEEQKAEDISFFRAENQ